MKLRLRAFCFLALSVVGVQARAQEAACSQRPAAAAPTSPDEAELARRADSVLAAAVPANGPGAAVLVQRSGRALFVGARGLADLQAGRAITSGTAFDLASVAKQFTALAVLILAERGQLRLTDTLSRFVPGLPAWSHRVTLLHLLGHMSGIPDYEDLWEESGRLKGDGTSPGGFEPDNAATIALLATKPALSFQPGERWEYSNTNYVLLARVVELVSGESLPRFLEAHVFAPLGMSGSRVAAPGAPPVPCRARSYTRGRAGYRNIDYNALNGIYGDGELFSTVQDLERWAAELDHPTLVADSTLRLATSSGRLNDGRASGYGLGWFVGRRAGLAADWHGGYWNGFKSTILRYPEQGLTVVVLANLEQADPEPLAAGLARLYLAPQIAARIAHPSAEQLAPLVGRYVLPSGQAFRVTAEGASLYVQSPGQPRLALVAVSPVEFYAAEHDDVAFRFGCGAGAACETLTVDQRGEHLARRARP